MKIEPKCIEYFALQLCQQWDKKSNAPRLNFSKAFEKLSLGAFLVIIPLLKISKSLKISDFILVGLKVKTKSLFIDNFEHSSSSEYQVKSKNAKLQRVFNLVF